MKTCFIVTVLAGLWWVSSPAGEELTASPGAPARLAAAGATGDYSSDIAVVLDAQNQALEQARHAVADGGSPRDREALQAAIQAMERARAQLEQARKSPDKLSAALTAEQSAYQALLRATPREYRLSRSRNRSRGSSSSGQPGQEELSQLELSREENRYETERQATAAPSAQEREQAQNVDRLKQLARRQQDLNERLRDLQTVLQQAHTEEERQEARRQLKRLRDEERQLLSDVDQLRQQLEQSPDAGRQADARQQLEQTHTAMEQAAQQLEQQSASAALAAGSRAEQNLQNLRENLRQQSSTRFAQQMRQLRSQARELANREGGIARDLDNLNHSDRKSLDDSAQRQALVQQLNGQQNALTNLLGQMRSITEQAEATEPLLSKQLYDLLRRADQTHTENQLELGGRLVERGFLPQAAQAEGAARQNIEEMRQGVEHAAESVLGSEAEALRYAQKELEDLARQAAGEMTSGINSGSAAAEGRSVSGAQTNALANSGRRASGGRGERPGAGTNELAAAPSAAGEQNPAQPGGQTAAAPGEQTPGTPGEQASATPGESNPSNKAQDSNGQGAPGPGNRQAGSSQQQRSGNRASGQDGSPNETQAAGPGAQAERERLRQFAQQLGGGRGGLGENGPITGNNYLDWADRMRDVEQAVDSPDVRNQLATVRERVGVYRRDFRERRVAPSKEELQSKVLAPLALARDWVAQELSHARNEHSLVPLDRDPVQEKYSDLVRKYYEELGSRQ